MTNRVQVAIRLCPTTRSDEPVMQLDQRGLSVTLDRHGAVRSFGFDRVYGPETSQIEIYHELVQPIVQKVMNGINGTVLAYGQTGTGKTYTMGILEPTEREKAGIIPRALETIFATIDNAEPSLQYQVHMSFVQIYLEDVQDLLVSAALPKLAVRQSRRGEFFADGLGEFQVSTFQEAQMLVGIGMKNRTLAATRRNMTSSRSHTMLNIRVINQSPDGSYTQSRLLFVDLAGSERIHPSSKDRQRIKEARYINSSLSALGNVICALSRKNQNQHIRFRDSKLTKLLEHSLRGNGKILLIATVENSKRNLTETLSTVKFATRCKKVECEAVVNREFAVSSGRIQEAYAQLHAQLQHVTKSYEEREANLHRMYSEKIAHISEQASRASSVISEETTTASSDATAAGYYALCNIANRLLLEKVNHPRLDEFPDDGLLVSYITELHAVIMDAMDSESIDEKKPTSDQKIDELPEDRSADEGEKYHLDLQTIGYDDRLILQ